jgi:putative membrane protein
MTRSTSRKPVSFDLDDPALRVTEATRLDFDLEITVEPGRKKKSRHKKTRGNEKTTDGAIAVAPSTSTPRATARLTSGFSRWGGILLSSIGALVTMAAGLAAISLVESLFARADWLGWLAVGLASLAALALFAIVAREIASLARLRKLGRIRDEAARAERGTSERAARDVLAKLRALYGARTDCKWQLDRLADAEPDIFDAADLVKVAERILMKDLDAQARAEIARTAKRVSIVTAVSPAALIDIGFVLVANLSLMRRLAVLYGGRPGTLGLMKLARMVIAHLTLTGGIALGDSLLQQIFGHGVAAKLSARLGEGVLNGLFTSRIGLAALEVCRPMPFRHLPAPAIKDLMSEVVKPG